LILEASNRTRQTGCLASALVWPTGEKFVNVLQFEASDFRKYPHHGGNAVLLVVLPDCVDDLPVIVGRRFNAIFLQDIPDPLFAPVVIFFKKVGVIISGPFTLTDNPSLKLILGMEPPPFFSCVEVD
jgi:hypothetical protein